MIIAYNHIFSLFNFKKIYDNLNKGKKRYRNISSTEQSEGLCELHYDVLL
jgi:hypothetical protein